MTAWPARLAVAKLRPFNSATYIRSTIVIITIAAFLFGDFVLFRRLFRAVAGVEEQTPLFALGVLRNLLSLVFLVASVVLFSSAMTTAIGAFFTDLDLDIYHAGPRGKLRIALSRWLKTLLQSAAIVFLFLVPLLLAFGRQYEKPPAFYVMVLVNLVLLLAIPVTLASTTILLLVRWFPVRRVHQIVASIAVLILTAVVVAFRVSRPERLFAHISTDDVARVLQAIELPAMSIYPSTSLALLMTRNVAFAISPRIAITFAILFAAFIAIARAWYFEAFVRGRESMAPVAIGSAPATRLLDRLVARANGPLRAMIGKEVRTITRDVAQWSQLFLMAALLFIYLYNVRMLPLGGDARATLVAYANLGMAGFVIAAICLRFAYPSVSSEGKAFWLIRTAPVSYRHFLIVKVVVYGAPLMLLALLLTAFANLILGADAVVWTFTLAGAVMLAFTLVALGVGMGALAPNFNAENPLQVGLSLGGFAYMAVSLAYVTAIMLLMARPAMTRLMWFAFGERGQNDVVFAAAPVVIALTLSAAVAVLPLLVAERRLTRAGESD